MPCSKMLGLSRSASFLLPSAAGVLLRPQHSRCEDNSGYYGSYKGDRFGGGIGNRVGVDESSKQAVPGTCISRIAIFSETHETLAKWATAENWKEATRVHKAAYFTRSENLVQEEVLEHIRQHYVAAASQRHYKADVPVQAALFRCDDSVAFRCACEGAFVRRIPEVVHGVFDEKSESCIVDFANKRLGGGWLSYGMVQEEKMFIERFDIGALCARSLTSMPGDPVAEPLASPFSMRPNEAFILRGAPAFAHIGWYGRTPKNGLERFKLLDPAEDQENMPTMVAVDAIKADFPVYQRHHLEMMMLKAYTGFAAAKSDLVVGGVSRIATGSWGCGAFYNNECVMFVIQALAANVAGVALTHHVLGDGKRLAPAFAFLEEVVLAKCTVNQAFEKLVDICAADSTWQSKWKPTAGRTSNVLPASKL